MAAHMPTLIPALIPARCPQPIRSIPTGPCRTRFGRLEVTCAASGSGPPAEKGEGKPRQGLSLPALSEIRWAELLAPSPDNAAAVALTAALVWASASLLLQLVLISASIFAAALKYSFVAALLLFVLIALL
ncbi:uncharacterized protein LOC124706709 [Lolium rigidum]|uniref:uncharacterized protein LOC124706709 n=1 Tax=Lolium rigidum TaxID=89674 RepID=UPI001F5C9243|nr:uncharacterized protein LOC124706709 [Lolium rigidum]